jgi:hypothetical protein
MKATATTIVVGILVVLQAPGAPVVWAEEGDGDGMSVSTTGYWTLIDGWAVNSTGAQVMHQSEIPQDVLDVASDGQPMETGNSASAKANADCWFHETYEVWYRKTKFDAQAGGPNTNLGGEYFAQGESTHASQQESGVWPLSNGVSVWDSSNDSPSGTSSDSAAQSFAAASATSLVASAAIADHSDEDSCGAGGVWSPPEWFNKWRMM